MHVYALIFAVSYVVFLILFYISKMESQSESLLSPKFALKRSSNFTPTEENLLVCLAKEYRDIIENKKSDTNTNRDKNKFWQEIEMEFNAQSGGVNRSAQVLRKKDENIKKLTKKKVAEEKCQRFKTGGGPNTDFKFTEVDETIMEVLGDTRVQGFPTEFGGDADLDNTETIEIVMEDIDTLLDTPKCDDEYIKKLHYSQVNNAQENDNLISWKKYSGEMLKTPKSKGLVPEKGNSGPTTAVKKQQREVTNKITKWAEKKTEVEAKKKEHFEAEYNLKLRLMQDKHNLEIQKEMEQTVKSLQEEQELKLDLLQLQKADLLKKVRTNNYQQ